MPKRNFRLLSKAQIKRLIKFGIFSNSGALVNTLILWTGHKIFNFPIPLLAPFALLGSIFCNFNVNDKLTWNGSFNRKLKYHSRLIRYLSTSLAGAFCTYIVLIILYKLLEVNYLYAIIIASLSGAMTNFNIYDSILHKTNRKK
jgi:putative flippase GtrA